MLQTETAERKRHSIKERGTDKGRGKKKEEMKESNCKGKTCLTKRGQRERYQMDREKHAKKNTQRREDTERIAHRREESTENFSQRRTQSGENK